MNGNNESLHTRESQETVTPSSGDGSNRPEMPSRRELIERYGKYAVVAPPLLLFVSRARGQEDPDIHSRP
jgi:hypothetical protein